jgi:hypothetical protein
MAAAHPIRRIPVQAIETREITVDMGLFAMELLKVRQVNGGARRGGRRDQCIKIFIKMSLDYVQNSGAQNHVR